MEEENNSLIEPIKLQFRNGAYVTKLKGKLVMVRDHKPETPFEIGMGLLGEAFRASPRLPKMSYSSPRLDSDEKPQFEQHPPNHFSTQFFPPMNQTSANAPEQPPMAAPSQPQQQQLQGSQPLPLGPEVTMGPHGYGPYPQPGNGRPNRQLALMPISRHRPSGTVTGVSPYAQSPYTQPWFSNGENVYGNQLNNPWQSYAANFTPHGPTIHNFTVTKHICANCGRLRSRKYQSENPIIAGTPPIPAFCRKCQKEASSTDDGSDASNGTDGSGPKRKLKKSKKSKEKGKRKDRQKEKKKNNSNGDALASHSEEPEARGMFSEKKYSKDRMQEDYVVVEEYKDEKGRHESTLRINIHDGPKSSRVRDPSPLIQKPCVSTRRSKSFEAPVRERYVPRERSPSSRRVMVTEREITRRNAYIEPPQRILTPREITRDYVSGEDGEGYYRGRSRAPRPKYDEYDDDPRVTARRELEYGYEQDRNRRSRTIVEEKYESREVLPPRRSYVAEDRQTEPRLAKSRDSSDGKHQERAIELPLPFRRGELPHNIGPLRDDEFVVVTERYFYRPKRLPDLQETEMVDFRDQRQETVDATTIGADKTYQRFSAESDASDYYHNDWNRERPRRERSREARRRIRPRDLREQVPEPLSQRFTDPGNHHRDALVDESYPPRGPSPPVLSRRPVKKDIENWTESSIHAAPYPHSEEKSPHPRPKESRKSKHVDPRPRTSSIHYRPPYVREVTDGGTEKALVPSPGQSRERRSYISEDVSESTEEIERTDSRHVSFRDSEGRDTWSASSIPLGERRRSWSGEPPPGMW